MKKAINASTYEQFYHRNQHSNNRHTFQPHVLFAKIIDHLDRIHVTLYHLYIENIHRMILDVDNRKHLRMDNVMESLPMLGKKFGIKKKYFKFLQKKNSIITTPYIPGLALTKAIMKQLNRIDKLFIII